jgi:tetratricopeptide (TPR) repeat protein
VRTRRPAGLVVAVAAVLAAGVAPESRTAPRPAGQQERPAAGATPLGAAQPGDVWTSGDRFGTYADATELSGRLEVARAFVQPAASRGLRGVCEARREAEAFAFDAAQANLADVERQGTDLPELVRAHHELGQLYAYRGEMSASVKHLAQALRIVADNAARQPSLGEAERYLETLLGVAELRRGEVENCLEHHNADRCLFPLRPRGQHELRSGSTEAIRHFERLLARDPEDLELRWLLNLAHMTLGSYPTGVPPRFLIPDGPREARDDLGRFVDTAAEHGLDAPGLAGGALADDLDGDGRVDVVFTSVDPCVPMSFYRNRGDGRFELLTREKGLEEQLGGINVVQADYDNDGRLDLFVARGGWQRPIRNSLLRQNPDGSFADVTAQAGAGLDEPHRTQSAAWADYDGDGRLDLFVGYEEAPSKLFRNRGDRTFEDVSKAAGVARSAFTKAVAWGDYDNDGRPDLYVSNLAAPNFLYHNEGDGTFREVARELGVDGPMRSFPAWFFDYDNDGWLDLFVASFVNSVGVVAADYLGLPPQAETMRLYHNVGGRFVDVTQEAGLAHVAPAMGANFGDLDGDGWLDIHLGTGAPSYSTLMPNRTFRNLAGRRFADVTGATGTGHLQKGHGVVFADMDDDGDVDLLENIGGFVPGDGFEKALFENPGQGNDWVRLELTGTRSNRGAIGARLRLVVEAQDGTTREIHRVVGSGGSFGSSPLAQHVGLGHARRIPLLEVRWPIAGAGPQTFRDLPLRQRVQIREGQPGFRASSVVPTSTRAASR